MSQVTALVERQRRAHFIQTSGWIPSVDRRAAGLPQREVMLAGLSRRFAECASEKNCTLIRYDIIQDLRNLYAIINDATVKQTALGLIETETDLKYRKKYASLWRIS
jgi:hypothetical protein